MQCPKTFHCARNYMLDRSSRNGCRYGLQGKDAAPKKSKQEGTDARRRRGQAVEGITIRVPARLSNDQSEGATCGIPVRANIVFIIPERNKTLSSLAMAQFEGEVTSPGQGQAIILHYPLFVTARP